MQDFNSVDEIYYFLDSMFVDGFNETHISKALDVFLRDFGQFEEKDLDTDTFKSFVRELGVNIITFKDEQSYVKTAKFLDWYCVNDVSLWINLAMYVIKKETAFSGRSLITIC